MSGTFTVHFGRKVSLLTLPATEGWASRAPVCQSRASSTNGSPCGASDVIWNARTPTPRSLLVVTDDGDSGDGGNGGDDRGHGGRSGHGDGDAADDNVDVRFCYRSRRHRFFNL